MGDRPGAVVSTWQYTTLTRYRHLWPRVGFQPAIPASELPQSHVLDRTARFHFSYIKNFRQVSLLHREIFKSILTYTVIYPYFSFTCYDKLTNKSKVNYHISRPIRRAVIFSLEILEKNNDERILILVIYWKKTGLLHTKISNHNIIYSS